MPKAIPAVLDIRRITPGDASDRGKQLTRNLATQFNRHFVAGLNSWPMLGKHRRWSQNGQNKLATPIS